jgi:D-alanyl-D-alanine carboxypeptidase
MENHQRSMGLHSKTTLIRQPKVCFLAVTFLFCSSLFSWDLAQHDAGTTDRLAKSLQFILDSLTGDKVIPGMTFAVRFKDGRMLSLASGYSDTEERTKMLPDAVMFSGSVGKTYVAALVLKLQEQGLLKISDKAAKYLDAEDWFAAVPNTMEMTLEMLLNHTAGVPEYVYDRAIWETLRNNPDKTWSVAERLSFVSGHSPSNPPGKGWAYADSHYILLGLVIEKVTKKDYYKVLNEMILQPLQLKNTRPALGRFVPGLPAGYTTLSDEMLLPDKVSIKGLYVFNPQLEWTGGGLVTTVTDLCQWASELYGGKVLEKKSLERMMTPAPFKTTLVENAGYGLGCFIGENNGVRYLGHTGFVPGYITILHFLPRHGISMAMQFNSDRLHGQAATDVLNVLKKKILDSVKD